MDTIRLEVADGIAEVTIAAPPLQLLNAQLVVDLLGLCDRLEAEVAARAEAGDGVGSGLKVVVVRSADPDFFVMHADVEMLRAMPVDRLPDEPNLAVVIFERLRRLPCVTIGVLDGAARGGGCELLCAFDIRIGSSRSVIGQPEVALGILPGGGGTVRWARTLGRAAALELLLTGRDMTADEARAVGWLQAVVAPHEVDATAARLARAIARMPAASIAAIKEVVDLSLDGPADAAFLAESRALARLLGQPAAAELIERFLAAGGQTRDGESGNFQEILDETLRPA
jgi:enoyl-CoA hydratase/carnithine racemase